MSRRLTVLVHAYACNPRYGSEEGVGWGWVCAIAQHHDLHVLTAAYHQPDIEAALEADPSLGKRVRFHYVPPRAWHYRPSPGWKRIEASIAKPIMHMAYRSWQRAAYRYARALARTTQFDLAHVITYVGFRFPGKFWKLPMPLVWGPIGGLENTPWRYFGVFRPAGWIKFAGRNVINTLHKLLLIGPRRAFQKAEGGVIAATSAIQQEIRRCYGVDSVVRCEIGTVDQPGAAGIVERVDNEAMRIVWSGTHEDHKALPLLLDALRSLPDSIDWTLTVLGSGHLTAAWSSQAKRLGIAERIEWTGRVDRNVALEKMSNAHVMVVTSVHDLTSTVIVEALCLGLPVICPDHYGFSDAVDSNCGFKVDTRSLQSISRGIATVLRRLYDNESERQLLARGALERAGHFSWQETGKLVSSLYQARVG